MREQAAHQAQEAYQAISLQCQSSATYLANFPEMQATEREALHQLRSLDLEVQGIQQSG